MTSIEARPLERTEAPNNEGKRPLTPAEVRIIERYREMVKAPHIPLDNPGLARAAFMHLETKSEQSHD